MTVDLRPNTIAQYKMNDNAANTIVVNEFGTNGNYNVNNTSVKTVTGKINTALYFDGTAPDYIDTNQKFSSIFSNSFSINFWIKPDDGQPAVPKFIFGQTNVGDEMMIFMTLTNIVGSYETGSDTLTIGCLHGFKNGQEDWHMITVTIIKSGNNATIFIYIDGTEVIRSGLVANILMQNYVSSSNITIGKTNETSSSFAGDMDNVCIFDKVLTQADIDFLYNSGDGTENLVEIKGVATRNNFFATVGDYDTREGTPDNASKLLFSNIPSDAILRTANNDFNHVMISGVPISVSPCFYSNQTTKFRIDNSRDFPDLTYFYAINVISVDDVSNQTLTPEERKTQFNDAKLYVNRWNALNYLNTTETGLPSVPTDTTNLFGSTIGLGQYGELIFNKTSYTISQIEEVKEVAFMNNIVSVGRIGNNYYLIITAT